MKTKEILGHNELVEHLKKGDDVYCLLYKQDSELSKCVSGNLDAVDEGKFDEYILMADVTKVSDIHPKYGVDTVPTLLVFKDGKNVNQVKGCNNTDFYTNLFSGNYFTGNKSKEVNQIRVTVYTTPTCTYCTSLKKYLDAGNIKYREVDISRDQNLAQQLIERTGKQGVPQTDINGTFVVGFDKEKISRLLEIN